MRRRIGFDRFFLLLPQLGLENDTHVRPITKTRTRGCHGQVFPIIFPPTKQTMVHKRQTKNKMLGLLLWLLPWSFWCNSEGYGRFFSVCSTHAFSIPHVKGRSFAGTMDKGATTRLFQSSNSNSGDVTRGAALLVENVDVYRGPAQILSQISWRVEPKTKWALVGANGSGKSTLLKAIVDQIPYDGRIAIGAKSNKIGYLQQTAVAGSNRTIYEEAASGMEASYGRSR